MIQDEAHSPLPEHDPQTAGQALSFLFQQVWLRIPNEARLPEQSPLLAVGVEVPGEPVGLNEAVEEGVEVVEGETGQHAPLSPGRRVPGSGRVGVLGPGKELRVFPDTERIEEVRREGHSYRLEVAG